MLIGKKLHTKAEFYEFIHLPQNAHKIFELINGEIVEKMPSFGYSSGIGARITTYIGIYLLQHPIAHFTDAQGGYDVDDESTLVPDIGVILKSRQATLPKDSFIPLVPDLAVEVVWQSDLKDPKNRIEKKVNKYREVGIPILWYFYPENRQVIVYKRGQEPQMLGIDGVLDGGNVLPGFTLKVRDIFPD
jgi:Uma2 family endonuclease